MGTRFVCVDLPTCPADVLCRERRISDCFGVIAEPRSLVRRLVLHARPATA